MSEEKQSEIVVPSSILHAGSRREVAIGGMNVAFRYCPAGSFMMGSPEDEKGRYKNEGPQHNVTLSHGFWLLETQVTQRLWKLVMGDNPSDHKGDDLPVEHVSWNDCDAFVGKLNDLVSLSSGERFRLPTEAEWEYACRAGTLGRFNGPDLGDLGWYLGNSDGKTHTVGRKLPNAWGLYDMHGNVWEWCSDWYKSDYYSHSPDTDPTGPSRPFFSFFSSRVLRGGSWLNDARYCRAAYRLYNVPSNRYDDVGFRLALNSSR